MKYGFGLIAFFLLCSCTENTELFQQISPGHSGVKFKNILKETKEFNVLTYGYLYNGGGVAVGDVNNDGLVDLYFTGNMVASKLYINQGNFKFKEVAKRAGVDAPGLWNTGTSMVDINGDGYLDIFVCRSAAANPLLRRNLLFINNGDLTFTEQAALLGLNDTGYTTQAVFFDYDRDSDLDLYVLNHSVQEYAGFDRLTGGLKERNHPDYGDKLYENVGGIFLDRTQTAGILTNVLGFGLGVAVADFNNDNWPDLYISNDYNEQDYLYINNKDKTFSEQLSGFMDQVSLFSMGSDAADINNDGFIDIFSLDMLPEGNARQKMVFGPDNYDKYQRLVASGFYKQTMRNMLQLNNQGKSFSEIGQMAGVSQTDWSWAALFADFDNDGFKDLFVTNGYKRDYTNMDFVSYAVQQRINEMKTNEETAILDLIEKIPATVVENYIFKNEQNLTFSKKNKAWGLGRKTLSNGAAYADLDNDGDLDLAVNNIDAPATIYRNTAERLNNNAITIKLKGGKFNPDGIGSKVSVFCGDQQYHVVQQPVRGFQSSVDRRLHFGLGKNEAIDSIIVIWPDGAMQRFDSLKINTILTLDKNTPKSESKVGDSLGRMATSAVFVKDRSGVPADMAHAENEFVDFKRERLIPHFLSTQGPRLAVGDVNSDGLDDLYWGGAKGFSGQLWLQNPDATFQRNSMETFEAHSASEDTDALFFDADGDGDLDLYVVSGGNESEGSDYQDRLYRNENGHFIHAPKALPRLWSSGSCVKASDYDNDGDLDLFVGTRSKPGRYPESEPSRLLSNRGDGSFSLADLQWQPTENGPEMVTDAVWDDVDADGDMDLLVVGEWTPVRLFENHNGVLSHSGSMVSETASGLWNRIVKGDFDNDGDRDFIIGNLGLNSQLKATEQYPLQLFYSDFDQNQSLDPILAMSVEGKCYPVVSRDDLLNQLNDLRSKYPTYASFAHETLTDIFNSEQLDVAQQWTATTLQSVYLENLGSGRFASKPLPVEAQIAPVYGILPLDYDHDGNLDVLLGGNFTGTRIQFGHYNASKGLLLKGDGKGNFLSINQNRSGIHSRGEIRDIKLVKTTGENPKIIMAKNNAPPDCYRFNRDRIGF